MDCAAAVWGLPAGLDVAVWCNEGACEAAVVDCAAVAGVQGHLVLGLLVYAFDYVDFAVVGPVGAEHPAVGVSIFFLFFSGQERGIAVGGSYKAGQLPHVLLGIWARSRITSPCL